MRQEKRSRGENLGLFVICFLVVRAVIVAWVVTVELFQVLEAVPVSGLRDYAVVLWLILARLFLPSGLPD